MAFQEPIDRRQSDLRHHDHEDAADRQRPGRQREVIECAAQRQEERHHDQERGSPREEEKGDLGPHARASSHQRSSFDSSSASPLGAPMS